jgi:hypothetical protein
LSVIFLRIWYGQKKTNRIIKNINGQNNENVKVSKIKPTKSGKTLKNKPAKSGDGLLTIYRKKVL